MSGPGLPRYGTLLLAGTAATAIADNHVLQPSLTDVAADLGLSPATAGLVPTATLVGCTAGFALLLPLTDRVAPHRLVGVQLCALAAGLVLAAVAPNAPVLLTACLLVGATAGVAAQAGAIAGRYAAPGRRGRAMATVATGLSAGILLGRWAGGSLADLLGWRRMLLVFAGLALLGALATSRFLPRERPRPGEGYPAALAAMAPLLLRHRPLRRAVALGGLWYFAFNVVWVALSLTLARPPYSLDATAIGLYSLAGLLGFVALPFTGRLVDRYTPGRVTVGAVTVAALGTAVLAAGFPHPLATVTGLALFDAGCFAAQAANQSVVVAVDPDRAGSLTGVYLVLYFAVGALGAALTGPLLDAVGWRGTILTALSALLAAAGLAAAGLAAARRGAARPGGGTGEDRHRQAALRRP
ncbi:MFS transporter [Streptomyces sp. NPDC014882]|uniref:MFS transporter n=1 Tax=Streptomyces sp. NPDC014882 TaxID=3364927 RepID=UPI0037012230